jgi:hypothetical protein
VCRRVDRLPVIMVSQRMFRQLRTTILAAVGGLFLLWMVVGCSKGSKPDYSFWTQRARSEEHVTPAFTNAARDLLAAIENERESVSRSTSKSKEAESPWKIRDDAAKQIRTRRDRDLYFLLEDYDTKVGLIRTLSTNREGAIFLPGVRTQVESCHNELQELFASHPVRDPPLLPLAGEPCSEPVPRTK